VSAGLTLVATPIGNLSDLSPRAGQALQQAEFWIVEDTRVSARLQAHLKIKRPMRVLNDHSTPETLQRLTKEIQAGKQAALVTDAGTPGISDPGAALVDACWQAAIPVDSIPGPSAVTLALALSGFYAQRFAFLGFLPRKGGGAQQELANFKESTMTLVLFESAQRMEKLLETAHQALGPRRYALCRELTKLHQQILRSKLPQIPTEQEFPRKGELTLVIEGRRKS